MLTEDKLWDTRYFNGREIPIAMPWLLVYPYGKQFYEEADT
jgi:hypothetical protein